MAVFPNFSSPMAGSIPVNQNTGFTLQNQKVNYPYIVQTPVNQLYSDYAQQYKVSQPALYNQLIGIANNYDDVYNRGANQVSALYQGYQNNLDQLYKPFLQSSQDVANQYITGLQPLYQDVTKNYGPDGELRKRTDDFYKNLYTYLGTKSAEQQAQIASDASKSGSSLQQSLASQNQVLRANLDEYIKAQQNNVSQLDNIYKSYQSMQTNLLDRYKATQDQNILKPLESIIGAKNQIGLELLKNQQALLSAQLSDQIRKGSVGSVGQSRQAGKSTGVSLTGQAVGNDKIKPLTQDQINEIYRSSTLKLFGGGTKNS